jgi:hypothetical protein
MGERELVVVEVHVSYEKQRYLPVTTNSETHLTIQQAIFFIFGIGLLLEC